MDWNKWRGVRNSITIVSAELPQHEIACVMVSTCTWAFLHYFYFSPGFFFFFFCSRQVPWNVCLQSISLELGSFFMIKNKLPSGHKVTNNLRQVSPYCAIFLKWPKTDLFGICIEYRNVWTTWKSLICMFLHLYPLMLLSQAWIQYCSCQHKNKCDTSALLIFCYQTWFDSTLP